MGASPRLKANAYSRSVCAILNHGMTPHEAAVLRRAFLPADEWSGET